MSRDPEALKLFLVAGEHSGDQLGGKLIAAMNEISDRPLLILGVGGDAMAAQGCGSLFPLSEIAVMGPIAILKQLRTIVRRVHQAVDAIVDMNPDALVILDSPEFTHAVAKRVRRRLPDLPVIDYVSPSIWAWRPGRAKKMRRYIDHVLAILPFEPDAHQRLGGPECTYVGHPLIERVEWIKNLDTEELRASLDLSASKPLIAVLPGSRTSEIKKMMPVYGETLDRIIKHAGPVEVLMPVVSDTEELIRQELQNWTETPHLILGEEKKFTAFKLADAALATSGTVTLELALAGTPMVVGYRLDFLVSMFRWLLRAHSVVLPNLILGENIFPEFIQGDCTPDALSDALLPLMDMKSPERRAQIKALMGIEKRMRLAKGTPSQKAAEIILRQAQRAKTN